MVLDKIRLIDTSCIYVASLIVISFFTFYIIKGSTERLKHVSSTAKAAFFHAED